MAGKGVVGLGRVVLSRRERPIAIDPFGRGMCGTTLRYTHEVRSAEDYLAELPEVDLPEELIGVAERLIGSKMGSFDPAFLEERYRTVLVEALKAKSAQTPTRKTNPAAPSDKNVIDLMAMLKRSMAQEEVQARKRSAAVGKPAEPKPRRSVAASNRPAVRRSKRS